MAQITGDNTGQIIDAPDEVNIIRAFGGNDTINGGSNVDIIDGGEGADVINGGAGTDAAWYLFSSAGVNVSLTTNTGTGGWAEGDTLSGIEKLYGSTHGDTLTGDGSNNELNGERGDDVLNGEGGADYMLGADGNDTLDGGSGDDRMLGGVGNDTFIGGEGRDYMDAGADTDTVDYSASAGVTVNLTTERGSRSDAEGDVVIGFENVIGSATGVNFLTGNAGDNTLTGGASYDFLEGGAGADALIGGDGIDNATYLTATAGVSANLAAGVGTGGDAAGDTYVGIERLTGSAHVDQLIGNNGDNQLDGQAGADFLIGNGGKDLLLGRDGNDNLFGGNDNDQLFGHADNDTLDGGVGNDRLVGGTGDDELTGGTGERDVFDFRNGDGNDVITDYEAGVDYIRMLAMESSDVSVAANGGDTVITHTGGTITLTGVTTQDFDMDFLLFAAY